MEVRAGGLVDMSPTDTNGAIGDGPLTIEETGRVILFNGGTMDNTTTIIVTTAGANPSVNTPFFKDGGSATISGEFTFDLSAAGTAPGNQWTIFGSVPTFDPAFSVAGATEGTPGVWTISANGAEYTFDESTGILEVTSSGGGSPYETWAKGGELFGDDANGDGISNGLAFLLGAADPDADATGLLPTPTEDGSGGLVLNFSMLDSASRGTSTLNVEHSSDLGVTDTWTVVPVPDTSGTTGAVTFGVSGSGTLNVTATIDASVAADGKLFGRLSASE